VASKDFELFQKTLDRVSSVSQGKDGSIRVDFFPEGMEPPPISRLGITIESGRKKTSFPLTKKGCFRFLNPERLAIELIKLPFVPIRIEFYVFKGRDPLPRNDSIMFRGFSIAPP